MLKNFFKKGKKKVQVTDEMSVEKGEDSVKFVINKEMSGKDSLEFLETLSEKNDIPTFKGTIKHCYESDFIKYKDKCPKCGNPTEQLMSNFAYATQGASRIATAPAGHFCTECPTVIVDDDMMKKSISKDFKYGGVFTIETGYETTKTMFETFNGEKPMFILDENQQNIGGILQSVHLIEDDTAGYYVPPGSPLWKEQNKKRKPSSRLRKGKMTLKKAKRKHRKGY